MKLEGKSNKIPQNIVSDLLFSPRENKSSSLAIEIFLKLIQPMNAYLFLRSLLVKPVQQKSSVTITAPELRENIYSFLPVEELLKIESVDKQVISKVLSTRAKTLGWNPTEESRLGYPDLSAKDFLAFLIQGMQILSTAEPMCIITQSREVLDLSIPKDLFVYEKVSFLERIKGRKVLSLEHTLGNIQGQSSKIAMIFSANISFQYSVRKNAGIRLMVLNKCIATRRFAGALGSPEAVESTISRGIRNGCFYVVKKLLEAKGEASAQDLSLAIKSSSKHPASLAILRLVIDKFPKNLNDTSINGETPLTYALKYLKNRAVEVLLEKGAHVETYNALNEPPLLIAIQGNNPEAMGLLLKKGAKIADHFFLESIPLQSACERLLDTNCNIHAVDLQGRGALHILASTSRRHYYTGQKENMATQFIKKGIDPNLLDDAGNTPLTVALKNKSFEVARALLKHPSTEVNKGRLQNKALHYAAKVGMFDMIEELLKRKADVNAKGSEGNTPLHLAMKDGYPFHHTELDRTRSVSYMIQMFHDYGADFSITNDMGDTPLMVALQREYRHYSRDEWGRGIKLLLAKTGNLKKVNKNGESALHLAAKQGNLPAVKALLERNPESCLIKTNNKERASAYVSKGRRRVDLFTYNLSERYRTYEEIYNLLKDYENTYQQD